MATGGAVGDHALNLIQATKGATPKWIDFYNEFIQNPNQISSLIAWMDASGSVKTSGNVQTCTIVLEGNPDVGNDEWGTRMFNEPKDENTATWYTKDFQLVNFSEVYGEDFQSSRGSYQARNPYGLSNLMFQLMVAHKRRDFVISKQIMYGDGENKSSSSGLGITQSPTMHGLDWWSRTGHGGLANTGTDMGNKALTPEKLEDGMLALKDDTRSGGRIEIWMNARDRANFTRVIRARSEDANGPMWTMNEAGDRVMSFHGCPIRIIGDAINGEPLLAAKENATGVPNSTNGDRSSVWLVRTGGYENCIYGLAGEMTNDPPQRINDRQRSVGVFEQSLGLVVPHSECYHRIYNVGTALN